MEYLLTDAEKQFITTLKATLIQAKAAVREAHQAATRAEADETKMQDTFEGAVKLLMNAHSMQTAALSADCARLTTKD